MKPKDLWLWYCNKHIPAVAMPGAEAFSPEQVLAALWTFHPVFTGRLDAIKATPYTTGFDGEADNALAALARTDSLTSWEGITAGAWRVLYERLVYCSVVVTANWAAGTEVIDHLPAGLPPQAKERALLLKYLLGHGRTIDRQLLPQPQPGTLPGFPASTPIRRH